MGHGKIARRLACDQHPRPAGPGPPASGRTKHGRVSAERVVSGLGLVALYDHIVASNIAKRCEVQIAYAIGVAKPVGVHVNTFGTGRVSDEQITMAIRDARWPDRKLPISRESTGLITAVLQLCAVASCPKDGLVTLDELETSLHPRAIQVLTEAFRQRSREQNLRIVLATQSETVLDQFHDCPEQIQVLEPNQETSPRRLTDMFGADWLKQFSLGDLFAHLEFGSNREPPAGP